MTVATDVRTDDGEAAPELPVDSGSLLVVPGRERQITPYVDTVRDSDEIDRGAWAKLLAELLHSAGLTPEQAAQPHGPVDANWRTIRKWLSRDQGISARRVRDVARALGYPATHALVQVGFLTPEEAGLAGPAKVGPMPDPLLRRVSAALTDQYIPDEVRTHLRRGVQHAYDIWLEWVKTSMQDPTRDPGRRPEATRP